MKYCECGCRAELPDINSRGQPSRFVSGHHFRLRAAPIGHILVKDSRGYKMVKYPGHHRANADGYVYEHIVAMERYIGRELYKGELVHHIDENKGNNSPDNLQIHTIPTHMTLHLKRRHHENRINERLCSQCSCKTYWRCDRNSYEWSRSKVTGAWLCKKCYQKEYLERCVRDIKKSKDRV